MRRLEKLSYRTMPHLRGALLGERRSRNLRPALDFSDHRPYSIGDDLRHVDWNAFGRHEELFVKLGEATQSVHIHVLLDCSSSMAWMPEHTPQSSRPAAIYSKWDAARRLAGALAYLGLHACRAHHHRPVWATLLAEPFGPTEGKRRVIPISLKFLADLRPQRAPQRRHPGRRPDLTVSTTATPACTPAAVCLSSFRICSIPLLPSLPPRGLGGWMNRLRRSSLPAGRCWCSIC
ncbi:MAG: DUF58 domain-containing protein [Anaerolineae bacterium]